MIVTAYIGHQHLPPVIFTGQPFTPCQAIPPVPVRARNYFTPGVNMVTTSSANASGILLCGTCLFLNAQFVKLHRPKMCTQHTKGCLF
jgi:hypothetical protein